jgi:hypothetical protein
VRSGYLNSDHSRTLQTCATNKMSDLYLYVLLYLLEGTCCCYIKILACPLIGTSCKCQLQPCSHGRNPTHALSHATSIFKFKQMIIATLIIAQIADCIPLSVGRRKYAAGGGEHGCSLHIITDLTPYTSYMA